MGADCSPTAASQALPWPVAGGQGAGGLEECGHHQQNRRGGWWHQVRARAGMGTPGVSTSPAVWSHPMSSSHQRGLRNPALRGKGFVGLSLWGSVLKEPWELAQAAAC